MLQTKSFAAPSSSIRCELRQIISLLHAPPASLRSGLRSAPICRPLSYSKRQLHTSEDALDDSDRQSSDRPYRYRRIHPGGKIIGRPGRRLRETTEKLQTNSLDRPTEVIVLRDVKERLDENKKEFPDVVLKQTDGLSAADIQLAISAQGVEPTQDEVDASINSLRPDTTILDDSEYDELIKALLESYNARQLERYLTKSLNLSSDRGKSIHAMPEVSFVRQGRLPRSSWRPGRTPISRRHGVRTSLDRNEISRSKAKLAQQILRVAWKLTVHSEEQQIGELELLLEDWQIRYTFDLSLNSKSNLESLIDSPILARNSEIQPYRPQNILRITARRQDAEEIATRLERKLLAVTTTTVPMDAFKPLLGKLGWPKHLKYLFQDSDLKAVGQITKTDLECLDDGTIAIRAISPSLIEDARRVLLSLLDIPCPFSTTVVTDGIIQSVANGVKEHRDPVLLPEFAESSLHLRYRRLELGRLTMPTSRVGMLAPSDADDSFSSKQSEHEFAQRLATRLDCRTFAVGSDARRRKGQKDSILQYRPNAEEILRPTWSVQLCRVLHRISSGPNVTGTVNLIQKSKNSSSTTSNSTVLRAEFPALGSLLSYFEPKQDTSYLQTPDREVNPRYLIAHLMPDPFTDRGIKAVTFLPRIEIQYVFTDVEGQPRDIHFDRMTATLEQQRVCVPLPDKVADLCFVRKVATTSADGGMGPHVDKPIALFTKVLRESIQSGVGTLRAEPSITMTLPEVSVGEEGVEKDVEIPYLFERFEQVQAVDLVPNREEAVRRRMNEKVRQVLDGFPEGAFLRYRDVEAGAVGGRRTELTLHTGQSPADIELPAIQLTHVSLGLADLLTRMNAGELRALGFPVRRKEMVDDEEEAYLDAERGR